MKIRFLHCADIHLGYLQYGHKERFNDFAAAFQAVIDKATGVYQPRRGQIVRFDEEVAGPVDFVVLAGDLFHKRSLDALTLNQAIRGLSRLREAGIPCIAVEGNHERAYYAETIGWMKFLALQGLLILLDAENSEGRLALTPWDPQRRQGAYCEPKPGIRVYGMRYYGASTGTALESYAAALAVLPKEGVEYSIFVTHAGVEGEMEEKAGGVAFRQWGGLRQQIDYVALGHFHKPFVLEHWIHNPGSPEACSMAESLWTPRGYLVVNVDTERPQGGQQLWRGNLPRRTFRQYRYKTDHARSPEALLQQLEEFLRRKARDLAVEVAASQLEILPAVVELSLTGVLPFDRRALDFAAIENLVHTIFQPLVVQVKSLLQSVEDAVVADETMTRSELERSVLSSLFGRDLRFAETSAQWTAAALALKRLALSGASTEMLLEELAGQLRLLDDLSAGSGEQM
ncbi:MAG: exonuclease SbcCD subunit D [Caldilinea sp.]|jgi:DNA repair exonuclease SbcCD nuclease subunit